MTEACWKRTGTQGDGSCLKLAELSHCRNCAEYAHAGRALFDRAMPDRDRQECSGLLAEPKQTSGDTVALMIFRVVDEWLALPVAVLEQVVEERLVHTVPGRSNTCFRGLVNIDGDLLFCYAAERLLGFDECGSPQRMLVASKGSERMVFSADEVLGARRVPQTALEDPPATVTHSPASLTKAVFRFDNRHVALLDADRWFECAARSLA